MDTVIGKKILVVSPIILLLLIYQIYYSIGSNKALDAKWKGTISLIFQENGLDKRFDNIILSAFEKASAAIGVKKGIRINSEYDSNHINIYVLDYRNPDILGKDKKIDEVFHYARNNFVSFDRSVIFLDNSLFALLLQEINSAMQYILVFLNEADKLMKISKTDALLKEYYKEGLYISKDHQISSAYVRILKFRYFFKRKAAWFLMTEEDTKQIISTFSSPNIKLLVEDAIATSLLVLSGHEMSHVYKSSDKYEKHYIPTLMFDLSAEERLADTIAMNGLNKVIRDSFEREINFDNFIERLNFVASIVLSIEVIRIINDMFVFEIFDDINNQPAHERLFRVKSELLEKISNIVKKRATDTSRDNNEISTLQ